MRAPQSDTDAYYGRLTKARAFSRRAVDSAVRADSKETAALWQVNAALREAEFGNQVESKQGVAAALALAPGRDVKVISALALTRAGDTGRAKTMVEELEKSDPLNTLLKVYVLPTLNAAIAVSEEIPPKPSRGTIAGFEQVCYRFRYMISATAYHDQ
jgi:eukaryotic-like serine/threonine-protein kinase